MHEKIKRCNHVALCACAVAIRAGKDVFMINICGAINYIGFTSCGEGGILEVLYVTSNKYQASST